MRHDYYETWTRLNKAGQLEAWKANIVKKNIRQFEKIECQEKV